MLALTIILYGIGAYLAYRMTVRNFEFQDEILSIRDQIGIPRSEVDADILESHSFYIFLTAIFWPIFALAMLAVEIWNALRGDPLEDISEDSVE